MSFVIGNPDDENLSQTDQANQSQLQAGAGVNTPSGSGTGPQGGTGVSVSQGATNAQTDQTSTPLSGGGTGVLSPGGGGNVGAGLQAPAQSAAKPTSSGAWTNLQSYLAANADQGTQVGNSIAQNVGNQAQTAQNDIANASNDFTNQVNANTVQQDSGAVNQAVSDATNATAGSTPNSQDVTNYQNQANANYGGPTDFTKDSGYQQAQQDYNTATTSLNQLGSEAGRDVLLQNTFQNNGQGGYNQGEQSLDQLLLEDNPANAQTFSNLANQYSGLNGALTNATTAGNQYAANAMATDQATAAAAQQALAQAEASWQAALNSQFSQAQQNYTSANQQIANDINSGVLTPAELAATGLQAGQNLWGLNQNGQTLANYITPGTAPTLANSASADQYAQAAALAQLAGKGAAPYLNPASASQAGTAGAPYTFNNAQFQADIAAQQGKYQGALQGTTLYSGPGYGVNAQQYLNNLLNTGQWTDATTPGQTFLAAQMTGGIGNVQPYLNVINNIAHEYGQGGYSVVADPTAPGGYKLVQAPNWDQISQAVSSGSPTGTPQ